ncbi:hypothetical protein [Microcoleus sp. herbarium14]|uniref:Tc toxin subunit A-related protein n=1 Tax=Microcoleus sp. herbarium14 TaxID=3055439 RepID=UPI002FD12972
MNNKKALFESMRFSGAFEKFLGKRQIYLQFAPFFHAHVSEFIKQLNRDGVPGLLNLANQTLGNPYLHSPWKPGYTISQASNAPACIIESGFGKLFQSDSQSARPGYFEALVLEGNELWHYRHDSSDISKEWNKAQRINNQATGAACIAERLSERLVDIPGVFRPGNFEVVILQGNELHHYSHDNSDPANPWLAQGIVSNGATGTGCIIESDFLTGNRHALEVVVLQSIGLVHYQKNNQTGVWDDRGIITRQATGAGCIIQSSFQSDGHGNFEVVVLEGNKLVHYSKKHTENKWERGAVITDSATSSGWMIQSRIRDGQHGNFEVVVCEGKQLVHYWKDNSDRSSPWRRGQVITNKATGAGCIMHGSFGAIGNFEVVVPEENGKLAHYWNVNEGDIGTEGERFYFDRTYKPTKYVDDPYPRHDVDFSYGGAYSLYNWELFFHAPMILASRLSQNQRFAEAMRWYHYIFDPTDNSNELTTHRFWKVLPFRDVEKLRIDHMLAILADPKKQGTPERQKIVDQIDDSIKNPFQPHRIARLRLIAYQKNVLMKYIDNLVAWGDQLFRRDTIESINEATQLYILVASLLGPRPQKIPKRGKVKAKTYAQLRKQGLNELQIVKDEVENEFPYASTYSSVGKSSETAALLGIGDTFYFCIPQNDKLMGYWDTVEDRLFKIRHCMNIEGVERQLPLFEPPIDPALLVQAAAKGVDLGSVLSDLSAPLPHYRFSYMLQKALEVCADLKSLGAALLSALEKRDAEELAAVRAKHETEILKLVRLVKEKQHEEAIASYNALVRSREVAVERFKHYQQLLGIQGMKEPGADDATAPHIDFPGKIRQGAEGGFPLLNEEQNEMDSSHSARDWQVRASTTEILANFMHYIPDFTIATHPFGLGVDIVTGGTAWGIALSAIARYQQNLSAQDSYDASHSGKVAGYWRRQQEWTLQFNLASKEILQINKQQISAQIRIAIAEQELKNHDKQIENAQLIEEFLHNKYTNEELYRWMQGEISTIFFQSYQLAYDLAKKAERCYRFERGITNSNFIQFGYWDSLRKGLMSGERLYLALKQLERAYHDQNKREYEITKNISLMLNAPLALITLKETGTCTIELPETLFDADYPGHYMRRIKSVSLTIPCVVGPYTSINCTLTLLTNKTRINSLAQSGYPEDLENEDSRFVTNFAAMQSIATSTAQNDSGLFELNFRDERYLPFEGAGAVSRWRIDLPKDCNAFDFATISDVILKLNYTAREGGEILKNAAKKAMQEAIADVEKVSLARLFSAKHEFPTQWHQFLNSTGTTATLSLSLDLERFPFQFRSKILTIQQVELFLPLKEGEVINDTLTFSLQSTIGTASEKMLNSTLPPSIINNTVVPVEVKSGEEAAWLLTVDTAQLKQMQDAIVDLFIICHYTVSGVT